MTGLRSLQGSLYEIGVGPWRAKTCIFLYVVRAWGQLLAKTYQARWPRWPPAEIHRVSRRPSSGNREFLNLGSKLFILHNTIQNDFLTLCGVLNIFFYDKPLSFSQGHFFLCVAWPLPPAPPTYFWILQNRKVSFLANGILLYTHL